jgi:hypothetical protein
MCVKVIEHWNTCPTPALERLDASAVALLLYCLSGLLFLGDKSGYQNSKVYLPLVGHAASPADEADGAAQHAEQPGMTKK